LPWNTAEGSTGRLLQLCTAYFFFYVLTGVTVKYFTGSTAVGLGGMHGLEFLVYSTAAGSLVALGIVIALRWYRTKSTRFVHVGPLRVPAEYLYIVPSGVCTAVVVPTTTLMYMLPISVMVAMVIMRASVIVISRIVDAIQIKQGILHRKVYWQENVGVGFALGAAGVNLMWVGTGDFDFVRSGAAVTILGSYIAAYAFRIYIMNYYKNTRGPGAPPDNTWFFAIEQIAASVAMGTATLLVVLSPRLVGGQSADAAVFTAAITHPHALAGEALLAGAAYGMVAFFSVFIFMFKGRTATFAGLVNRLTSLVAGTTSTLVFALFYRGKLPKVQDWMSLLFIFVAVGFLTLAERRRVAELVAQREIDAAAAAATVPARG
jgi:hypothetical protein